MSKKQLPPLEMKQIEQAEFSRVNRRGLLRWAVLSAAGLLGLGAIYNSDQERGMAWPLRKIGDGIDGIWKKNFDSSSKAYPTPTTKEPPRINGDIGMEATVSKDWRLNVKDLDGNENLMISLEQIKSLPSVTESFEFKCIEGWSRPVTCKGVRFSDFMEKYGLGKAASFAGLSSVNEDYYVSMDMKSLMHPQTLLCYEMNGAELTLKNGYPLRLIASVKYGVKNIKQMGYIDFTNTLPADFWAEQGYGDDVGL